MCAVHETVSIKRSVLLCRVRLVGQARHKHLRRTKGGCLVLFLFQRASSHLTHYVPEAPRLVSYLVPVLRRCSRDVAAGYGMLFVPSSPGSYDLDCVTWRPRGSLADRLSGETAALSFPRP